MWFRRDVIHVWDGGSRVAVDIRFEMVLSEIAMPSPSSSPWM
jgi:hypothetical protein